MDGYQATAAIRRHLAGASVRLPIIALTANAIESDRDHCLNAAWMITCPSPSPSSN